MQFILIKNNDGKVSKLKLFELVGKDHRLFINQDF